MLAAISDRPHQYQQSHLRRAICFAGARGFGIDSWANVRKSVAESGMRQFQFSLLFCIASSVLRAQLPAVYPHQVVNAASFLAPGLPAGSIAQGSIFSIFGTNLGPAMGVQATSFPLGSTLAGVSITAAQGSNTVNVLPVYVQQGQINALMPSNTPTGWISLRVTYNGLKGHPSPVYVVHDSPGIFTFTGSGGGAAAIQNIANDGSLTLNSNQNAATPGETVQMYLTGLGPITAPDNQPPPANAPTTPVEVWVGGVSATVSYSGRSPCCSGLDQIDFVVPTSAPQGCWVPIEIRTSQANVSNGVSMAIAANGGACSDPENPFAAALLQGGALGDLALVRTTVHQDVAVNNPIDITSDTLSYLVRKQPGGPFVSPPFLAMPPPGSCTLYAGIGDYWSTGQVADATSFTLLDGGSQFTVANGAGSQVASATAMASALGSSFPLWSTPGTLVLSPGSYTVSGNGGADTGPVSVSLSMPGPLTWTNRDQTTMVNRSQPLTLNWTGQVNGQTIEIMGENSDLRTNSSALFYCTVPAGASSFTVPPQILAFIPATRPNLLDSTGIVFLIAGSSTGLSAKGLDTGVAWTIYQTGKTVVFE